MIDYSSFNIKIAPNYSDEEKEKLREWILASVLFSDECLSKADLVDVLLESYSGTCDNVYQIIDDIFTSLQRAEKILEGNLPYTISGDVIFRSGRWQDHSAFAFCLITSITRWLAKLNDETNSDERGKIFEKLVECSMRSMFHSDVWKVIPTSQTIRIIRPFKAFVPQVARELREEVSQYFAKAITGKEKDSGVDVILYHNAPDNLPSISIFIQCATGKHWKEKLHEPNLELWKDYIHFSLVPLKSIVIPMDIDNENEYRKIMRNQNTLLIDRLRILSASKYKKHWLDSSIKREIVSWVKSRLKFMPHM